MIIPNEHLRLVLSKRGFTLTSPVEYHTQLRVNSSVENYTQGECKPSLTEYSTSDYVTSRSLSDGESHSKLPLIG